MNKFYVITEDWEYFGNTILFVKPDIIEIENFNNNNKLRGFGHNKVVHEFDTLEKAKTFVCDHKSQSEKPYIKNEYSSYSEVVESLLLQGLDNLGWVISYVDPYFKEIFKSEEGITVMVCVENETFYSMLNTTLNYNDIAFHKTIEGAMEFYIRRFLCSEKYWLNETQQVNKNGLYIDLFLVPCDRMSLKKYSWWEGSRGDRDYVEGYWIGDAYNFKKELLFEWAEAKFGQVTKVCCNTYEEFIEETVDFEMFDVIGKVRYHKIYKIYKAE